MSWDRAFACVVWLAVPACGGPATSVVRSDPADTPSYECEAAELEWFLEPDACPEPAREVVRFLERTAQLALEGNEEALLARYAEDATIVRGRRARAEPYDLRFDRTLLAAEMPDDGDEPSSGQTGFVTIEVWFEGAEAYANAVTLFVDGMGEDSVTTGESYRLARAGAEWRVAEVRSWPVDWAITDERVVYDDAYWAAADERVDVARRALEQADAAARADAQRMLVSALRGAQRPAEALELVVALTESTDRTPYDWMSRSYVERSLGELDRARASAERADEIGWPSAERALRDALRCLPAGAAPGAEETDEEEDEEDEEAESERCSFEMVAVVTGTDASGSAAIAKLTRGDEEAESHVLLVANESGWQPGPAIADGPFVGNQTSGVERFELSEVALRDLLPGGRAELYARYLERRYPTDDDPDGTESVEEQGHLVCQLSERPVCARIADRVRTTIEGAPRATEASATVEFLPEGRVRVRARRGRHARILDGERAISELFGSR